MKTLWVEDAAHSQIKLASAVWQVNMASIASRMCEKLGEMIFAENGKDLFFGDSDASLKE